MDEPAREPSVPSIVASIDERSALDTERLITMLCGRSWPGGSDRTERAALEWVKRWGPSRITAQLAECSCLQGRCSVCN